MELGRNKEVPHSEQPSQESSAPVGQAHSHAEQLSLTPPSSKDTNVTEEKTAESKPPLTPLTIDSRWGWDILALTLAIAILIAIIVILHVYDGRYQPT